MPARRRRILILKPSQRRAITQSPARLEIMDTMSEIAPCSVAQLARELGRSPQSLYYHVEIMEKAGLLKRSGSRRAGKREEALYDLASDHFRLAGRGESAEEKRGSLLRFSRTVLKLTEKNYRRALGEGLVRRVGTRENIYVRRQRGRMTDADLTRFYDLLDQIGALFAERAERPAAGHSPPRETPRERTHSYALTVALIPLDTPSAARER